MNGIIIGIVADLDDPENLARVKVSYPYLEDTLSDWARLVTFMAGKERGGFYRPEIGEEVLVAFEQGDPRRPYILGGVWNSEDRPPEDDGKKTENNWRFFTSRSGHVMRFDDTSGKERIDLIDKDKKLKIIIDTSGDKIQIICDSGDVEVSALAGTVKVDAKTVEVNATADMSLIAGGTMTIQGATVNIN